MSSNDFARAVAEMALKCFVMDINTLNAQMSDLRRFIEKNEDAYHVGTLARVAELKYKPAFSLNYRIAGELNVRTLESGDSLDILINESPIAGIVLYGSFDIPGDEPRSQEPFWYLSTLDEGRILFYPGMSARIRKE